MLCQCRLVIYVPEGRGAGQILRGSDPTLCYSNLPSNTRLSIPPAPPLTPPFQPVHAVARHRSEWAGYIVLGFDYGLCLAHYTTTTLHHHTTQCHDINYTTLRYAYHTASQHHTLPKRTTHYTTPHCARLLNITTVQHNAILCYAALYTPHRFTMPYTTTLHYPISTPHRAT